MKYTLVVVALFACACSKPEGEPPAGPLAEPPADRRPEPPADRRPEVLASLADNVVIGHYADFEARAAPLAARTAALCADPRPETLAAAREAWLAACAPWKRASVVRFGPVLLYPDRLGPKLDTWPVNTVAVEMLVAGEGALDQAAFDGMGTATRGIHIVEFLLWGQGDDTLAGLKADARRCAALVGAAQDVHANASRLADAWRMTWGVRVGDPGGGSGGPFSTPQAMIDEWVNQMAFTLENIRAKKLGKPAGDRSGGALQLAALESRYSARSLMNARDALAGVRDVWAGDVGGSHPGLADLLADRADLVKRVDQLFDLAQARLAEIPEPLEASLASEPRRIVSAQDALKSLQVAFQVDVAQALGVTITFNDNDGD